MLLPMKLKSRSLSHFRTSHQFQSYIEVKSHNDIVEVVSCYSSRDIGIYPIGNGSNTFFTKKTIKTLVMKNLLPQTIEDLGNGRILVSSSCNVMKLLKYCHSRQYESFYYLSSVPATIGGAVAMNAGRGHCHNQSILDFVQSVTFVGLIGDTIKIGKESLNPGYRQTIFSESFLGFITSVEFLFARTYHEDDPIIKRIEWALENQDYVGGNCGSIFKQCNSKIMRLLKGVGVCDSWYSRKTVNWINNKSASPAGIWFLIVLAKVIHFFSFQQIKLEIRCVR